MNETFYTFLFSNWVFKIPGVILHLEDIFQSLKTTDFWTFLSNIFREKFAAPRGLSIIQWDPSHFSGEMKWGSGWSEDEPRNLQQAGGRARTWQNSSQAYRTAPIPTSLRRSLYLTSLTPTSPTWAQVPLLFEMAERRHVFEAVSCVISFELVMGK